MLGTLFLDCKYYQPGAIIVRMFCRIVFYKLLYFTIITPATKCKLYMALWMIVIVLFACSFVCKREIKSKKIKISFGIILLTPVQGSEQLSYEVTSGSRADHF